MSMDYELFRGKKLSDLFEDIYRNQQNKKKNISFLIKEIRDKATKPKDMAILYPIVKDLVETSVKNDDALIKMAAIAQRIINSENKSEGDNGFLSEKEKEELLEIARKQADAVAKKIGDTESGMDLDDIEKTLNKFNEPQD